MLDAMAPGAYAKIACEEVRGLRALGEEAFLVLLHVERNSEYRYEDIASGLPTLTFDGLAGRILNRSWRLPGFRFFSTHHLLAPVLGIDSLRRAEFDLVLAHGAYTCFTAMSLQHLLKVPFMAFVHDPVSYILPRAYGRTTMRWGFPILLPLARELDRRIVADAELTLTNSLVTKQRLEAIPAAGQIRVLYPGCYPSASPYTKRADKVLAATKWDRTKRPEFLLDLLEHMPVHISLILAGFWIDPEAQKAFLADAKRRELGTRVNVTGPISEDELLTLYRTARCLVHPYQEAFGMTCLEAASQGCPVIAADGSGIAEVLLPGQEAIYAEEGDLQGFVEHTTRIIGDGVFAERLGTAGWAKAWSVSWENHARCLKDHAAAIVS